jgi:multiple sugar transport system permease protein
VTLTTRETRPRTRPGSRPRPEGGEGRWAWLFLAPWIIGFCAFIAYPILYSLVISLFSYSGLNTPNFIGLGNYTRALGDPLVRISAGNTAFYAALAVPITLVIAVLVALAMNQKVREVKLYRTALYLPSLVPVFALSFIFIVFVNPQFGLVNRVLSVVGAGQTNFLGDPTTAKLVLVGMAQLGAGNAALIFLAGLNAIPRTLYEAAEVDGAGVLRRFFSITLPLLTPSILFNLITGISTSIQVFTEAYVMTEGGPNNGTLFYMFYLYNNAFRYAQLGYASALALLLFLVGMVLAVLVFVVSRRFVNYEVDSA